MNTGQRFLRWTAVWLAVALAGSSTLAQTLTGATSSSAQSPGSSAPRPNVPSNFGPGSSVLSIGAVSFVPLNSADGYAYDSSGGKFATSGLVFLDAGFNLPTGAVIDRCDFEVFDNDASNDILASVFVCPGSPAGSGCSPLGSTTTSGASGWQYLIFFPSPTTVDNLNNQYFVEVGLQADGGTTVFRRALIYYHLQVSPAPGTATFNDVPTSDFGFQFVEAFAAAGITVGCTSDPPFTPPVFCPDRNVTRREMAIFFAKALGLYFPN